MSDATPNLGLPLIAAAQAQKHVTHNEALQALDALVQLACLDKDLAAPPPSPAEGDRYLVVAASPTGAWAGLSGQVVRFAAGVWTGSVPRPGWFAYVLDEADLYIFDGQAWTSFRRLITAIELTGRLGINTTPDATNRLAVKSDAALLSWDDATPGSGDMRVAINKQAPARDAGIVFETGYAARALVGTLGGDDFVVKVSPDGAAFATALTASAATGGVDFASAETALAAAATTDLGAAGTRRVLVTGSAPGTSFGGGANRERLVRFAGTATLVHDAARLALPTRASIVTAADDTCLATSDAAGNWRVRHYQRADGSPLLPVPLGQCQLVYAGATALTLKPLNGNLIWVAGANRAIPAAGVNLPNTGLGGATLYYVYAALSGSTLTLEASTTGHAADPACGHEVKSTDGTRTLVGMAYTGSGTPGTFVDTAASRWVASWFNRRARPLQGSSAASSTASTSPVELSAALRVDALTWGDEAVEIGVTGAGSSNAAGGALSTQIGVDGGAVGAPCVATSASAGASQGVVGLYRGALAEGRHALTILGSVSAGQGTWSAALAATTRI
jgi:hypothetical protein